MAKKVIKISQAQLNEMVKKAVKNVIKEGKLGDYLNDVGDNIRAGYSIGNGEPKNWKEAVTRCGYDVFDVGGGKFKCSKRYGFMGSTKYQDSPEDVVEMLKRFSINARFDGVEKGMDGQDVYVFSFLK